MNQSSHTIKAEPRVLIRKSTLKNMRKIGHIPAVLYSKGQDQGTAISVNLSQMPKEHTRAQVVQMELEGKTRSVVMREVQVHPITRQPIHFDFQEVGSSDVVNMAIPLNYVGLTREQEKEGLLSILVRYLKVKGDVSQIPTSIDVNVGHLKLGQSVRLSDVSVPESVKVCMSKNPALPLVSLTKP